MQQLAAMEPYETQSKFLSGAKVKTPETIGESLFHSLLSKEGAASPRVAGDKKQDASPGLQRGLGIDGSLLGALILPQYAAPRLAAYLEKCGLSSEKIDLLVKGATDKEGNIHLGRLFSRLNTEMNIKEKTQKELIVEASQVPRVEKLLQDSGLGAGEVKTLIESSVNRDGALVLGRLQKTVDQVYPGKSQLDLSALLKQAKIACRPKETGNNLNDETIKNLVEDAKTQPIQRIKEQLAVLLRDKGATPEETKSFLETVSVRSLRSLAAADEGTPWDLHGLKDLLQEAKIGSRQQWQPKDSREAFMRMLKGQEKEPANDPKGGFGPADARATSGLKLESNQQASVATNKAPQELFTEPMRVARNGLGANKETVRNEMGHPVVGQAGNSISGTHPVDSSGAAASAGPRTASETASAILEKMVWMAHAGQQRSRIQLSPPELGRLDVHLVLNKGHLSAHIGAESLAAKEVLDSNLTQLRQQLTQLGFVVDRFEVMVGLDQQGSGRGENLFDERGRRGTPPRDGRRVRAVENVLNGTERQEWNQGNHQVNMLV